MQGCFGKDCIPSIDNPKFETASEADKWLAPDDRIFALEYNGVVRAYPQRIMNWHEIVNDQANGTPIAVTFCPLCGSALAFERRVDGMISLATKGPVESRTPRYSSAFQKHRIFQRL
ncbi:DUF3179 domain-containing protein [Candidatus Amesbacteria bacterium]|nr:DUF3179 domain-containing protein [Candidatus Amesbacteria bacterium]